MIDLLACAGACIAAKPGTRLIPAACWLGGAVTGLVVGIPSAVILVPLVDPLTEILVAYGFVVAGGIAGSMLGLLVASRVE